jgi:DNA-directed RNA polymerase specialized sigma24 family protein
MEALCDLDGVSSKDRAQWDLLFLEHLEEFARLAWYLVADDRLVEDVIRRTTIQLHRLPFDTSAPELTYNQARETIIQQSIAVLKLDEEYGEPQFFLVQPTLGALGRLPRLAFMLSLILRSPEAKVAKLLDVTPSRVRELVQDAITSLSLRAPESLLSGCFDA